jgi:hypothetical protein
VLDIVLVAPLAAVLRLRPLVVHVQQGQVVAARGEEILPSRVCVNHLYSSRKRRKKIKDVSKMKKRLKVRRNIKRRRSSLMETQEVLIF